MRKLFIILSVFISTINCYAQCTVTITGNNTICAGQSTTLTANVTGNSGNVNYTWTANPGPNPANTQNITVSPSANTTYTVTVNGGGCNNVTASTQVNVNPLPNVPTISVNPTTAQCSGTPFSFSVSNPQGGVSYSWNFGDGTNGTGATTTHSYNSTGNGTVTFNVTVTATLNGCTRTSNVLSIQVRQRPDASLFDPNNTIEFTSCGGGNFNLTVSNNSTTTSTNANYVINWGDGTPNYSSSTFTSVNHTYNSQGNFTITLTVTGQNGCVSSRTYSVYNGSNPAVGLGNPGGTTGLCAPATLTFPITGTQNNTPGTTYTITVNDGSNPVIYNHPPPQSHTHTFNITSCGKTSPSYQNSFFVSIKAENPCASSTATIEPITINSLPDADFSIPPTACVNTPVTITNTSDPGAWVNPQNQCDTTGIFNWIITPSTYTLTQGTLGQNPPQPNNQNSWGSNVIRPSFSVPGTYTVKLKIRNRSNCGTDSIQKQICIQPQPTANFTFNQNPLCAPSTIQITNQSNTLNTCGNTAYSWTVAFSNSLCATNGTYAFINGTNPNSINPVIRLDSAGVYTVTQTVTNICGTVNSSQTITVKGRPKVTIDNIPNICANSRTINPTATVQNCYASNLSYSWSFTGGTPISSSVANPTNITFPNPGTYTISLTVTNECGTASATTTFSNTPLPTANAGPDTTICVGNSVRIGGNPTASGGNGTYTYSWSPTANLSSSNIANPIANPTATTTYTVTVISNNCTATDQVTVTVNPRPTVSITPNNPAICIGNSATLTASGGTGYVWSTGATTASITVNPTSNTNYSVTVTNANGCTNTGTSNVTVNPLPNIVINPNNPAICIGNSATLTASGGTNYVWSTGATTASITVNPTINTTYSVTGTNANGCSNTANTSVTVNALPNVSATANQNVICAGQSATLTATGASSYTWSPPTGLNTTTGATVTASPTVTTTYIVTGTSGLNCQDTGRVTITVNPQPTITITPNNPAICIGNSATLTASGGTSYVWSTGATTASITVNPTSNINYTVTVTNANGCTNTAISNVTVNPLPNVSASPDQQFCNQNIPVQLTGTPSGGTWSGTGVTSGGSFNPSSAGNGSWELIYTYTNQNNCTNSDTMIATVISPTLANAGIGFVRCINEPQVNLNSLNPTPSGGTWSGNGVNNNIFNPASAGAGQHILTYSVGNSTCQTTDTIQVIVNPQPTATITPINPAICIGNSATLTASGGTSYVWNTGATTESITVNPTSNTNYTVTATNANGCTNTATSNVTVNPLPNISAGPDQQFCNQNIPVQLTGTPSGGTWSGAGVTSSGLFNPSIAGLGQWNLTYSYTDINTCTNTDTVIITVIAPTNTDAGTGFIRCVTDPPVNLFSLNPSPLGGTWSGTGVSNNSFFPAASGAGQFVLIYTTGLGTCETNDTIHVIVNPQPTITITPNTSICIGDSIQLNATGGNIYIWSPASSLNNSNISNPIAQPNSNTNYSVTVTDNNGCSNTNSVNVIINPLPNVNAGPDKEFCNQNITEQISGSPQGGTWSGNGITSTGIFNPSIPGLGQWVLTYTFTDNNGCVNADDMIATVIEPIPAIAGPSDTFCLNSPAVMLQGFSPAGGVFSGQGITDSQTGLFNPSSAGSGIKLITYSYGSGTCLTSASTNYMVRPLPLANFTNNITCIGDSTQFADLSNPIEGNIIKWVWNFGDGDSSIFQNPTHTYNANGDYFVKLFIENSVGCFNDTTIKITVRPLPTVTFTHPPIGCPDSSIFFLLTTVDAVQYNWDFGDGNTGTGANPTHIYTNSGTYTIRLNAVTQFGCIDSSTSTIIIAERPSAYFIATPDSGCGPLSVVIRYLPQTSANGFDYTWTLGNGDTIFSMIPPDTVVYLPPTLNGDTTYYISAWVQSRVCQQIDVHRDSVKVFSVPRISFIPNNSDGCSPLYVNFSNQTKGLIDSILIDFGNGNDTIIYGRGAVYQTFQNYSNTDTFYHVKFKAFNKCGITEDSLVISVFPNTVNASINIVPPNNCANEIFTLYNNSSGARYIYYDLGSGYPNISSDTSKTITFSMSESGEYWIYQYIYSGDSCSADIDSFKITVYENPNSDFDYKDSNKVCAGSIQVIFINKSIDAVKYYWNLDDGNTINQFEPFYEYETSGRYDVLLIAESEFGCRDSLLKTISLEYKNSGLYVPNAFSPEFGEEVVRTFKPAGLCLATYKLSIYNTWGELVWETDKIENEQPAEGWDGRHMKTGVLLPQDV